MTVSEDTPGTASVTVNTTAMVAEAPVVGSAAALSALASSPFTNETMATFTHGNNSEPISDFQATIEWGDATSSVGSVTFSTDRYVVQGSHTYSKTGLFPVTVMLTDGTTATTILSSTSVSSPPTPVGSPGSATGTPNEQFVERTFHELLRRDVDPSTLKVLNSLLEQGISRLQVVQAILLAPSHEFFMIEVQDIYHTYLRRDADPTGLQSGVLFLAQGGSLTQLTSLIISSPEYYSRFGGGNDSGFLRSVFRDTEGKDIGPSASAGVSLADQSVRALGIDALFSTNDFLQNLTKRLFVQYTGSTPDAATTNFVATALQGGLSVNQLIALLVANS
jgi:hypothetical protein